MARNHRSDSSCSFIHPHPSLFSPDTRGTWLCKVSILNQAGKSESVVKKKRFDGIEYLNDLITVKLFVGCN